MISKDKLGLHKKRSTIGAGRKSKIKNASAHLQTLKQPTTTASNDTSLNLPEKGTVIRRNAEAHIVDTGDGRVSVKKEKLIKDVTQLDCVSDNTFSALGLHSSLCKACNDLGFTLPTAIQRAVIPWALSGRDVIAVAETGSGKTAAFALPILHALLNTPNSTPAYFALILEPTRELAYQVSQQFEALGCHIGVRTCVLVGGMDMASQQIAIAKKPHIIIATPGRLIDHLEHTRGFSLNSRLKYLVLDEADRLLDMDFGPALQSILRLLPTDRCSSLYSATLTCPQLDSLQRASLRNPVRVDITAVTGVPPTDSQDNSSKSTNSQTVVHPAESAYALVPSLVHTFLFIPHKYKDVYLVHLLNGTFAGKLCILFTRTVVEAQRVTLFLRALSLNAIPLHGQLSQSARLGALAQFRAGSRNLLVATDVAARGIDIPHVDGVINVDVPATPVTYVHRVGRTARAGNTGKAVTLVTQYDVEAWLRVERALRQRVPQENVPPRNAILEPLLARVNEARRVAAAELRDTSVKRGAGSGKSRNQRKRSSAPDNVDQRDLGEE